jgi:Catalytic LigB subunit of aromatic ring-opening dioxygenase
VAQIVHAFASSHGPQLSMPPDTWDLRSKVDRARPSSSFRDKSYSYEELLALRDSRYFVQQNQPIVREQNYRRSQAALDRLADALARAKPDVLVLIGDDQHEWFHDAIQPALAILCPKEILNKKFDAAEFKHATGIELAAPGWRPPQDQMYPVQQELAVHLAKQSIEDGFDVTICTEIPVGATGPLCITHSLGFIVRRIMRDRPVPLVPILLNTFYPPNQIKPGRCLDFGRTIASAIRSWQPERSNVRVALCASGGLSHYVVDEEWDQKMLKAMLGGDERALRDEPNAMFQGGTSETKNWITLCGAMATTPLKMKLLDYIACYRTEAGTGNAMAFATWE